MLPQIIFIHSLERRVWANEFGDSSAGIAAASVQ